MMDQHDLMRRFLQEQPQVRLAHVASDLLRIFSSLRHASKHSVTPNMINECKWFCEWAAIDSAKANDIETAHILLTLQRQLVRWDRDFDEIYADPVRRAEMAETARAWSNHLLVLSGLLTQNERTVAKHDPA